MKSLFRLSSPGLLADWAQDANHIMCQIEGVLAIGYTFP
jgi:hypothetical protein